MGFSLNIKSSNSSALALIELWDDLAKIEKEMKIKRRVKGAMVYPTVVLVFAVLVLIGIMAAMIVPEMKGSFEDAVLRSAQSTSSAWLILP